MTFISHPPASPMLPNSASASRSPSSPYSTDRSTPPDPSRSPPTQSRPPHRFFFLWAPPCHSSGFFNSGDFGNRGTSGNFFDPRLSALIRGKTRFSDHPITRSPDDPMASLQPEHHQLRLG